MAAIHIGISGWRYTPWRGDFYPEGLTQKRELQFASRAVNSIEINGSFYALQTPKRYAEWYGDTPEGFVFSVKAPRFITHMKKLRDVETPLANFFASGPLLLEEHVRAGGFVAQDRRGQEVFHPLVRMSIGVVRIEPGRFVSHHEISRAMSDAKAMAKKQSDQRLFIERRQLLDKALLC